MDIRLQPALSEGFQFSSRSTASVNASRQRESAAPGLRQLGHALTPSPATAGDAVLPAVDGADPAGLARQFSPLMRGLQGWSRTLFQPASDGKPAGVAAADQSIASADYSGAFSLKVKTRDGDTVTIHFSEARGGEVQDGSKASSYEIEGDISDAERKALDQLVEKMVGVADTFFSDTVGFGHLAVVDNLSFFDAGQLASFALDVSQERQHLGNQKTDRMYSSLSFAYEVDLSAKTQHLSSELVLGYQQSEGAGRQRFGYDLNSAIVSTARQLLAQPDVRALGRPGIHQSGPTALPSYYQGALQALSSNIDRLSELLENTATEQAVAEPEETVAQLFRGLAENHPAYKSADARTQQSLGSMFDLLPSLIRQAHPLNAIFANGTVREQA
jgi:hypothetical protein